MSLEVRKRKEGWYSRADTDSSVWFRFTFLRICLLLVILIQIYHKFKKVSTKITV